MRTFEYLVIGAGSAGLYTTRHLLTHSKSVAVIYSPHRNSLKHNDHGSFLFWVAALASLPFQRSYHQRTLSKALHHLMSDPVTKPYVHPNGTISSEMWSTLRQFCQDSGAVFIEDTVVALNRDSVTLNSGDEICATRHIYLCTGGHLNLLPFPYTLVVHRHLGSVLSPDLVSFSARLSATTTWMSGGSAHGDIVNYVTSLEAVDGTAAYALHRFAWRMSCLLTLLVVAWLVVKYRHSVSLQSTSVVSDIQEMNMPPI